MEVSFSGYRGKVPTECCSTTECCGCDYTVCCWCGAMYVCTYYVCTYVCACKTPYLSVLVYVMCVGVQLTTVQCNKNFCEISPKSGSIIPLL